MWIFFTHLPSGTTTQEINKVTLKGCKPSLRFASLFMHKVIKRSKIVRIRDLQADISEYHAIVQVDSPITAKNIIKNLNGKTIKGLYLRLHRYHRRFTSRDRRHDQVAASSLLERRRGERRRSRLITQVMEIA